MNNRNSARVLYFVVVIAALILSACSTPAPTSTSNSTAGGDISPTATTNISTEISSTATENSGNGTAPTPTIDVEALIREKLQNHHDIDRIFNAHHTREEWNATLDRMNGYGANISDTEKQIIIDYLMSRQ